MNKQIIQALRELGVPADLLGYEYLKYAIELCLKDRTYINAVTKRIYPMVANHFDTTPARAERAIRHAIESSWIRANRETIQKYFGYSVSASRGKPTNSEYIATVAEQIRLEQEAES